MLIKFTKIRDVKTPARGTSQSAGIDFFIPERTEQFTKDLLEKSPGVSVHGASSFAIRPHGRVLIPSGIKVLLPENTALVAFNKSGIATKLGLDVGACVVDEDYTGEIHLSLVNTTESIILLDYGQKIIQFLLLPVMFDDVIEVSSEKELYSGIVSERGSGGFGSTGK